MANSYKYYLTLGLLMAGSSLAFAAEDVTTPSDVENLAAFPGDGEIVLTWDPATDDIGVEGYYVYFGLNSVSEDGGSYTFGSTDKGAATTATMDNLTNGISYYFAVTAYDEAGNESEFYSFEVEGTPEEAGIGDFTSPTVSDAEALTSTLIQVTFSEDLVLPADSPEAAFSIESSEGYALEVIDAYLAEDESMVFVVTDEQTTNTQYILTAGVDLMDASENPIISGTSDTAVFTASSLAALDEEEEEESDLALTLVNVEAVDANELLVTFGEDLETIDAADFEISLAENQYTVVEVISAEIDADDSSVVTLLTGNMSAGFEYMLAYGEEEMEFYAKTLEFADLIPPEDITNFLGRALDESTASLSWVGSLDSEGDLAEYLLTHAGDVIKLAKDLTSYDVNGLTPGETYTFKVSAVDESGNESDGVSTTLTLPEAGPGMIAMAGLSLLGAGFLGRRKKE